MMKPQVDSETDRLISNNDSSTQPQQNSLKVRAWMIYVLLGTIVLLTGGSTLLGRHVRRSRSSANSTSASSNASQERRYKATQFISFTINTLGGLEDHGECKGRQVSDEGGCYLGNSDLTKDVYHRLSILNEVLDRLKANFFLEDTEIDRSSSVLKIFMVPEFFMRGPEGAYSIDNLIDSEDHTKDGLLIQFGDQVREIVAGDVFEDFLFVFGTIIAAAPAAGKKKEELKEKTILDANDLVYYNFAPVIKGGTGHDHYYIVQKRYISGVDFLTRSTGRLPNPADANLHRYADAQDKDTLSETLVRRGTILVEDNLLNVDGIRIGVEICLDHRMGTLWNIIQKQESLLLVDVQLIVSAGMAIERGPNPLVPGGVVYLSDGEASSAACIRAVDEGTIFDPDQVCRGQPDGLKHIPQGGPGYSDFFPPAACLDMEKIDLLNGYYSLYQTQGCAYTLKLYGIDVMDEFKYYPPSIEIYPTVDLPNQ